MLQAPPRIKASSLYPGRSNPSQSRLKPHQTVAMDHLPHADMESPEGSDLRVIFDRGGGATELGVFTYDVVDTAMSNAGWNWGRTQTEEGYDEELSDEELSDEEMGMHEDDQESPEEDGIEPSGLHTWDELGEGLERDLAAIGEFIHLSSIHTNHIVFILCSR
jgi:hypothetical protein